MTIDLLNLFAKIVLDSSEYKQGVEEAQDAAEDLASTIEDAGGSFDDLADSMVDTGDAAEDSAGSQRDFGESVKDSTKESQKGGSALDKYRAILTKVKSAAAAMVAVKLAKWFWDTTAAVSEFGDHIDKASQKMGLSAQAYQEWSFIAEHSGTNVDSLTMSMKTLTTQAAKNSDAFAELGLSYSDIKKMSQEELFEATIRGLQNVEDTTERTVIATQLLGRGAMELGALFNASGGDIDKMKKSLDQLGGVMSEQGVKKSAAYADAVTDLKTALQGAKNNVGEFFMEFNTSVVEAAAKAVGWFNNVISEGKPQTFAEELKQVQTRLAEARKEFEDLGYVTETNQQQYVDLTREISNLEQREAELVEITGSANESFAAQEDALAELRDAYAETYDSVVQSLEGWFGAFDSATYEVTTSADEMMENLQSQADFWTNYEANLRKLSDAGFDELANAIRESGKEGAQYADVLAGMTDAGDEELAQLKDISEKYMEVADKREEAADTVTAIQFKDNSDETLGNIASIKKNLSDLDGKRATVYVDLQDNTGGVYKYAHAGGLDYVPYHNYPALLHEGERVLTKEENQAYTENNNQNSTTINQYIETVPQTPVELAAATAAYFEQARWAV